MGLLDSPQQALYIAILYFAVQLVESNMITPFIQKKMIQVPAALLLFTQMLMGALNGGWGVIMATPVLVVVMSVVQELYTGKPKKEKDDKEDNIPTEATAQRQGGQQDASP